MVSKMSLLLNKLHSLSPMPSDEELMEYPAGEEDLTVQYEQTIIAIEQELNAYLDKTAINPLVYSFGLGTGFGMYWKTLHLLERFASWDLLPIVYTAIKDGSAGVRYWCCEILMRRRNVKDLPYLLPLLYDQEIEVRLQSLTAIQTIAQNNLLYDIIPEIIKLLNDTSPRVQQRAQETIRMLEG